MLNNDKVGQYMETKRKWDSLFKYYAIYLGTKWSRERGNRILMDMTRSMMAYADLSLNF